MPAAWLDGVRPTGSVRVSVQALPSRGRSAAPPEGEEDPGGGGRWEVCDLRLRPSPAALHFHHVDPEQKSFGLARRGITRSIDILRAEIRKCVLLCSNCHAEVEAGATRLP